MSTPYDIVRVPLTATLAGFKIVGTGTLVSSFVVLAFPAATIAFLRLGQSGAQIPVTQGLRGLCLTEKDGIWCDVPAAAAGELVIAVFYGPSVPALALGT